MVRDASIHQGDQLIIGFLLACKATLYTELFRFFSLKIFVIYS